MRLIEKGVVCLMQMKKEWVAMLLAGGQGSRLHVLTQNLAKPAVPYGGKYRIIDFPLSNCVNSGIDTVGVLTQYQPLVLNDYIGNGQPWDLDRFQGGVHVLPPYQKSKGSDWYKGTANAIYQNLAFLERYHPEYVLILSGDHIYKMDYRRMLEFHKRTQADCTIAALQVPWEEASRFGLMNCDEQQRIKEFEEKPKKPKSNLASMGIYIFSYEKLKQYLMEDEENPKSQKDFGKNVLPAMLARGERMFAYPFEGYWKDVGTIDSLYEANLDLLNPGMTLDLRDSSWRIYSRSRALPPHYIGPSSFVQNSVVTEGCTVEGTVDYSILSSGVTVEEGATVRYSVVMPGAVIKKGAVVQYAILAEDAVIGEEAQVGMSPEQMETREDWGIAVVANGVRLSDGAQVAPKEMVDQDR